MTPHAFDDSGLCARCGTRLSPGQVVAFVRFWPDCDALRADVCDRHRLDPDKDRDGCPECAAMIALADIAAEVMQS